MIPYGFRSGGSINSAWRDLVLPRPAQLSDRARRLNCESWGIHSRPKFITIFHKTRNQVNNSISAGANSYCSLPYDGEFSLAHWLTGSRDEITNLSIHVVQKPASETRSRALQARQSCMKKKREVPFFSLWRFKSGKSTRARLGNYFFCTFDFHVCIFILYRGRM